MWETPLNQQALSSSLLESETKFKKNYFVLISISGTLNVLK